MSNACTVMKMTPLVIRITIVDDTAIWSTAIVILTTQGVIYVHIFKILAIGANVLKRISFVTDGAAK
jgi:hypothetical protein